MENKKVLFFVPEFPVISQTFIQREISKLVERDKLDITVVAMAKGEGFLDENLKDRVFYRKLTIKDSLFAVPYFFRGYKVIKTFLLLLKNNNRGFLKNVYLWLKSFGYAKIVDEYKPDQIHAQFMSESSSVVLIVSIVLGVPFSISAHARDVFGKAEDIRINPELVREKVQNSRFISVCNKYAYDHLLSQCEGLDTSRIFLQYHGVDFEELLRLGDQQTLEKPQKPVISAVGSRMEKKKGLEYLIDASKDLRDRGFDHILYLGGPGYLYDRLRQKISSLGLDDTIKIVGEGKGLPFSEIVKYYKIADVFAFPSIKTEDGDQDGLANVLVEASVFKVPIVSTDVGSTSDLIEDGKTGLIVQQKNHKQLAEAIEKLITHKDLAKSLSEEAYKRAKGFLDLNKNAVKLENLLLE